jgi:murein endopeptidase
MQARSWGADNSLSGGIRSLEFPTQMDMDLGLGGNFCEEWNPDYKFKGKQCCGPVAWKYRRRGIKCDPSRSKRSFCGEATPEQLAYIDILTRDPSIDVLELIDEAKDKPLQQAYCNYADGFLAWGRPLLPNPRNRIVLRRPDRCVNFGTDAMVAMIEWLGRDLAKRHENQNTQLLVGDISAPRGGCLSGRGGRRGHKSHTQGRDVDLGFIFAQGVDKAGRQPGNFQKKFEPEANWEFLKRVFENPYACVKVVFLDRRHISKLAKHATKLDDPAWMKYRRFLQHARGHQNHYHIRIGDQPGAPGCQGRPEDEDNPEESGSEEGDSSA